MVRPGRQEEAVDAAAVRVRLANTYWIGGGSGAGKSVIARRLAVQHDLRVYATDEVMPEQWRAHQVAGGPVSEPLQAHGHGRTRSPEAMLETFHWFRGEGFGLIVEDLLDLPAESGVIAEGFRLLPHLVEPLLAAPGHAVWLLPTPGFRRAAFASRGSLWEIAGKTGNPHRALHNLLERDRMFTDRLRGDLQHLGLPAVEIDLR
jgi:hypothetical protein